MNFDTLNKDVVNKPLPIKVNWEFLEEFVSSQYSSEKIHNYFGLVLDVLCDRGVNEIGYSKLQEITLPSSKSKIINNNGGKIFAFKLDNFAGIFQKNSSMGDGYERNVNCFFCDIIKNFNGVGLMTTDELPNYGISRKDKNIIVKELDLSDNDVGIFFCLSQDDSMKSYVKLMAMLKEIFE